MTDTIVKMHNAWSENDGDLLMYYSATGDYQWGFTDSVYNMFTPKLLAIDKLGSNPKVVNTLGVLAPGVIPGNMPSICNRGWGCTPLAPWDNFTAPGTPIMRIIWAAYNFRTSVAEIPHAVISISNATSNAKLAVYLDGNLIATKTANGNTSISMDL